MTFADDINGAMPVFQAQAESLMKDVVVISRLGAPLTDPDSGVVTVPSADVYAGRCKVQLNASQSASPEAGGHQFTVQQARLDIPVGASGVQVGDVAVATFLDVSQYPEGSFPGESVYPSALRTVTFRVVELFEKSYATAQRLRVEQVTG